LTLTPLPWLVTRQQHGSELLKGKKNPTEKPQRNQPPGPFFVAAYPPKRNLIESLGMPDMKAEIELLKATFNAVLADLDASCRHRSNKLPISKEKLEAASAVIHKAKAALKNNFG